jgi:hypothetical protein
MDARAKFIERPAKPFLDPPRRASVGERLRLLARRIDIRWRLAAHRHLKWRIR